MKCPYIRSVSIMLMVASVMCAEARLSAAETATDEGQKTDAPTVVESRADAIMGELAAERRAADMQLSAGVLHKLAALELLARKAEAYLLVEQVPDAARMMSAAQTELMAFKETLSAEELALAHSSLSGIEQRMYVIASAALAYTEADQAVVSEERPKTSSETASGATK